jgi:hypothetical protein
MAPSLVEYHLKSLFEYQDECYLRKNDVQNTIYAGDFTIYLDYNGRVFLENTIRVDEYQTGSLF